MNKIQFVTNVYGCMTHVIAVYVWYEELLQVWSSNKPVVLRCCTNNILPN